MKRINILYIWALLFSSMFAQSYTYNIKIAAHVVRNSQGQYGITASEITTALNNLNNIFTVINNSDINFSLAYTDYIDNSNYTMTFPTIILLPTGFEHETRLQAIFDEKNDPGVIHVFFIKKDFVSGTRGVAIDIPGTKLIITNEAAILPEILAHEIAHCLGLLHTYERLKFNIQNDNSISWSDGIIIIDPENVTRITTNSCYNANNTGDLLPDTPADPMENENTEHHFINLDNCSFVPKTGVVDNCQILYTDPGNVLLSNIMSIPKENPTDVFYCSRQNFTAGQKQRMKDFLNNRLSHINNTITVQISNKFNSTIIPHLEIQPSTLNINSIQYLSGSNAYLKPGTNLGKTNQERFYNYQMYNIKHHDWNSVGEKYHQNEFIDITTINNFMHANFLSMNPITAINSKAELSVFFNADMEFKDPWYLFNGSVQQTDQANAGTKLKY